MSPHDLLSSPVAPRQMRADSETISISIGLGGETRAASSIVLPRGHDLVKHLERLLPQIAQAAQSQSQSQQSTSHGSFAPPSPYDAAAPHNHMMHQRHHPYLSSSHRYAMPLSPCQSDSSHDSATPSHGMYNLAASQHTTSVRRRRGAAGQSAGKKCQFPSCEKISVSRGLCRGHGGGRRCQYVGCSKGAQSRSDFCWAHGGGQRCEVKNCMRSRKSKRFCVAHLNWESVAPGDTALLDTALSPTYRAYEQQPKTIMPKPVAPFPEPSATSALVHFPSLTLSAAKLPSLQQALQKNQYVSAATGCPTFVHHHHHQTAVLNSASG